MRVQLTSIAVAGALVATPAWAHHSFAPHFDSSKPVSISGVITEFEGRNPHSYVHIQAVDENGKSQEYVCESHGVTQLTRNGVTPQIMKAGARIRVTGSVTEDDVRAWCESRLSGYKQPTIVEIVNDNPRSG